MDSANVYRSAYENGDLQNLRQEGKAHCHHRAGRVYLG